MQRRRPVAHKGVPPRLAESTVFGPDSSAGYGNVDEPPGGPRLATGAAAATTVHHEVRGQERTFDTPLAAGGAAGLLEQLLALGSSSPKAEVSVASSMTPSSQGSIRGEVSPKASVADRRKLRPALDYSLPATSQPGAALRKNRRKPLSSQLPQPQPEEHDACGEAGPAAAAGRTTSRTLVRKTSRNDDLDQNDVEDSSSSSTTTTTTGISYSCLERLQMSETTNDTTSTISTFSERMRRKRRSSRTEDDGAPQVPQTSESLAANGKKLRRPNRPVSNHRPSSALSSLSTLLRYLLWILIFLAVAINLADAAPLRRQRDLSEGYEIMEVEKHPYPKAAAPGAPNIFPKLHEKLSPEFKNMSRQGFLRLKSTNDVRDSKPLDKNRVNHRTSRPITPTALVNILSATNATNSKGQKKRGRCKVPKEYEEGNVFPGLCAAVGYLVTHKEDGKSCRAYPYRQKVSYEGCLSKRVMNMLCYGSCASMDVVNDMFFGWKRMKSNRFRTQSSCRASKFEDRKVTLECTDGVDKVFNVPLVTECRCLENYIDGT